MLFHRFTPSILSLRCLLFGFVLSSQLFADCGDKFVDVESIQGKGLVSPMVGKTVITEAVVTAVFQQAEQLGGFFIQGEDKSDQQSHGLFVYSRLPVVPGERVRLRGKVREFYEHTELNEVKLLNRCGVQELPKPFEFTWEAALNREAVEGVLIAIPASVINWHNQLLRFGQIRIGDKRHYASATSKREWIVDDASSKTFPPTAPFFPDFNEKQRMRLGAKLNPFTAIVSFGFDEYRLYPIEPVRLSAIEPLILAKKPSGQLRLAASNVFNLFNGNGKQGAFPTLRGAKTYVEYQRQLQKVVLGLVALNADVLVLNELENDGFAESSTIMQLLALINDTQNSRVYKAIEFDKVQRGSDAITNAIIYDVKTVSPIDAALSTTQAGSLAWGDKLHRPGLIQRFTDLKTKKTFRVVALHLKSKGSECLDDTLESTDKYGACNSQRLDAVQKLNRWLTQDDSAEPIFLMGDLNSYLHEPPVQKLFQLGFQNPDLDSSDYSYAFNTRIGTLDYILTNAAGMSWWQQSDYWHVNADEMPFLDYKVETAPHAWLTWSDTSFVRYSDHDPVYVDLKLK